MAIVVFLVTVVAVPVTVVSVLWSVGDVLPCTHGDICICFGAKTYTHGDSWLQVVTGDHEFMVTGGDAWLQVVTGGTN